MSLFVVALLFTAASPAQTAPAPRILRLDNTTLSLPEAEAFARKTLEANHVTGAEIAVLNHGKLVWSAGFGIRREPDLPMTPDTNTWAASFTKSLFATYVMQLVQRREFDLDTPVVQQLPEALDTYEPFRSTATDLVKDPAWARVTPRMLLSHSSGLGNLAAYEPGGKMHLYFAPGTAFRYSGDGINVVQLLVEQQQHRPLNELMADAFFTPLNMHQTGMIYRKEFEDNIADRFDSDGKFHAQTRRFPARASGNMSSSANDLAAFLSALLGNRLLEPQTLRAMLSPVLPIRTLHEFGPNASTSNGSEAASVGLAYGLGWGLLTHTKFGPAFFKEGHGDGAQNYMICFERQGSCMIVLTNSDNGELAFRALFEGILGDTVTPWEWEGYTPAYIMESRKPAH